MAETQAQRIERYTALARKAFRDEDAFAYIEPWGRGARIISRVDGLAMTLVAIDHPQAHAGIEAALLVLAGESGVIVDVGTVRGWEERAESAEHELATLREQCAELTAEWRTLRAFRHECEKHDFCNMCGRNNEIKEMADELDTLIAVNKE